MTEIRITLSEKDFGLLVRGQAVRQPGSPIAIALDDIGWDRIYFQIERAMRDQQATDGKL